MLKEFNKFQGAGNDFIIIDDRDRLFPHNNYELISSLCDRRYGIGADGLILIRNIEEYDFEMIYYNSDGNPGTMCGNGGRCAYLFALNKGIVKAKSTFKASDGLHSAFSNKDGTITLSMNNVEPPVSILGNNFLDTGSPHYIIPVPSLDGLDVKERGRSIRYSAQFKPGGTNVNFIEALQNKIKIRTYERGVEDETLACGTGITAAAISSRWGKEGAHVLVVEARGGTLKVRFNIDSQGANNIQLIGPAQNVFGGTINLENYITK